MFAGVSLPPRSSGFLKSTRYPGQGPLNEPLAGHGCVARNFRTGAGFREIWPLMSRTQLLQEGAPRMRGGGILGLVITCALRMAQSANAIVPIRNKRDCFETIARTNARRLPSVRALY